MSSPVVRPVAFEHATPRVAHGIPSLVHGGIDVSRFITLHVLGAVFPISAALMFYGWRAALVILGVVLPAAMAIAVWRRMGRRGSELRYGYGLWLALLLALTLPAHLARLGSSNANGSPFDTTVLWPILPAAGIALVILVWTLGGTSSGRIHPVLVTHLLLFVLFPTALTPNYALRREHAFTGDVLDATLLDESLSAKQAWSARRASDPAAAVYTQPAADRLGSFSGAHAAPDRAWISLASLLRDRMPPLEDLIVGGHPGPIGTSSAIAIIIGGLFLLYRGVIDYRIPLLICFSCLAALLVLPVPVLITENSVVWQWLAMRGQGVGWPIGFTFANYEIMASPLLFTAFFLATSPGVRPMTRRARTIYALLVGLFAAAAQLYVSVSIGPYLALLAVSLLTPTLDKMFRPRSIV